jgi:hypothetical protein
MQWMESPGPSKVRYKLKIIVTKQLYVLRGQKGMGVTYHLTLFFNYHLIYLFNESYGNDNCV